MAIYRIPVKLESTLLPSPAFNVWHARVDTSAAGFDWVSPTGPIGALEDFYQALSQSLLAPNLTISFPSSVVDVETADEEPVDAVTPWTTQLGDWAPPGLAVTVSWKTGSASRRGRGRTFLGPIRTLAIDTSGRLAAGPKADVTTAVNALVATSSGVNGWAIGVYGQQDKGILEPKVLRDITSGVVSGEFAHLRSRRD